MNLHPGKMELPAAAPRRTENRSARRSCYGPFLFKIMLLFLGFMTVLVIHLYLRQQSVKAAERTEDLDKQIKKVEAETRNLRNQFVGDVSVPAFVLFYSCVLVPVAAAPSFGVDTVAAHKAETSAVDKTGKLVNHTEVFIVEKSSVLRWKHKRGFACVSVNLVFHIAPKVVAILFVIFYFHICKYKVFCQTAMRFAEFLRFLVNKFHKFLHLAVIVEAHGKHLVSHCSGKNLGHTFAHHKLVLVTLFHLLVAVGVGVDVAA